MEAQDQILSNEIDFNDLLGVIQRYLGLIAICMAFCLAVALAYVTFWPPTYEAVTTVRVPNNSKGSMDMLKDLAAMTAGADTTDPMETFQEIAKSRTVAGRVAASLGLAGRPEFRNLSKEQLIVTLQKKASIGKVKKSSLLEFKLRSRDPQLASDMANSWTEAFIKLNLEFDRKGASSQRKFIEEQLAEVKLRLLEGEEVMRNFSVKEKTLISQGNDQGRSGRDPIISLKSQVMALEIEKANLSARYVADHPKIREMNAQLREAQAQLNSEMAKLPKNEMALLRLSREVKVDEAVYNLLLQKGEEARIAENAEDNGIVVVDPSEKPEKPVAPRRSASFLLALLGGLALGLVAAFGREFFRDTVDRQEHADRATGLPHLGIISDFRSELKEPLAVFGRFSSQYLITNKVFDFSFYKESFKVLRTNITFTAVDRGVQAIAVLSPGTEEGKSLLNANLAISLSQTDKKVLLVDADLRKPAVHKMFGVEADHGLPMVITGQADLDEAIVPSSYPNLWLLPNNFSPPNSSELLGSEAMKKLVLAMKNKFDYIVFDGAPILAVTDSVVLSGHLDGVILAARAGKTHKADLRSALNHLNAVKAKHLGTVLNGVNLKTYYYGYGTGGYGYGKYRDYGKESSKVGAKKG